MVLWFVRAIFIILVVALLLLGMREGGAFDYQDQVTLSQKMTYLGCLAVVVLGLSIDMLVKKKSLASLAGIFFGLTVGLLIGLGFNRILDFIHEIYKINPSTDLGRAWEGIKGLVMIFCIYLSIVFIMQTKDDFRFIIPYVEFSKQTKGSCPLVLDTSVIIDGRIADIAATRILNAKLIIPRFILDELQQVADSPDRLRRNRGRRGLDMLNKLQTDSRIDLAIEDIDLTRKEQSEPIDLCLVTAAQKLGGKIITNDYNLNKVASIRGVEVININDLANALKPVVLPGEAMRVKVVKPGDQPGQGVGYMDDGTMIVVESGRSYIGAEVDLLVTSVLQTSAGRMIFGKLDSAGNRPNPVPQRMERS